MLDAYLFESVAGVQGLSDERLRIYNERRPHEALGSVPPVHLKANVGMMGRGLPPNTENAPNAQVVSRSSETGH